MNLSKPLRAASRVLNALSFAIRTRLPRQRCNSFVPSSGPDEPGIGKVIVINLNRQRHRWENMLLELDCIADRTGASIVQSTVRYAATDGQSNGPPPDLREIQPFYTLADQLFVEPQPQALPDAFDLAKPIRMSAPEIAVAQSHIGVWKDIARSASRYTLVLEDDVWFDRNFARTIDRAWLEMEMADQGDPVFDILYVSYKEARHGAPKELLSESLFRPENGLWFLSGYVLSQKGAERLLECLPCRGPIDLWINQIFHRIDVRGLRRSLVNQRGDTPSGNSYSILPMLSQIGVIDDSESALFHQLPLHSPVFVFGPSGTELSSLAMALSMLGYRCCSDLDRLPESEHTWLLKGSAKRVFDAYVNIRSLTRRLSSLISLYPRAKFILFIDRGHSFGLDDADSFRALANADVLRVGRDDVCSWRALCEHLKIAPPLAAYPFVADKPPQKVVEEIATPKIRPSKRLRYDRSPWVVEPRRGWAGINAVAPKPLDIRLAPIAFSDSFDAIALDRWILRNDTFPGNLGLFRPANVAIRPSGGISLRVNQESLGVRDFSAASICSRDNFLYGRFEASLQATDVPGVVTGFFLHRNSPRQEIDVEIAGNRPDHLLVNVFFNPGSEGAKFDYGYRGSPVEIPLGFDASKGLHTFTIEWNTSQIRWFVDGELVHRRVSWNPTPIPHLPMQLHFNNWPTRSHQLAGRLVRRSLPTSAVVVSAAVDAQRSTSDFLTCK